MNISLAILEDNHLHYEKISSLINSWATNRGHLVQIHWFQTGFDIINSEIIKYCQLLFSDIELSEFESDNKNDFSNGIEICAALRKKGFSGEIIFFTSSVVTAKDTSVGGTSISSKDPLIESLPPIAPTPNSF